MEHHIYIYIYISGRGARRSPAEPRGAEGGLEGRPAAGHMSL